MAETVELERLGETGAPGGLLLDLLTLAGWTVRAPPFALQAERDGIILLAAGDTHAAAALDLFEQCARLRHLRADDEVDAFRRVA